MVFTLGLCFCLFGCGKKEANIEGSLDEIMVKLYEEAGIKDGDILSLGNVDVTKETLFYYLGVEDLDYKEALASESMVSSIPHSVVLVRMNENANIEKAKKVIKEKINPKKWIYTEVEPANVIVESWGDMIVVIMDNEYAKELKNSFSKLASGAV